MSTYDGVFGIDQATLNEFIHHNYAALHDFVLKGTVRLKSPEAGVTAISYDIASIPQVTLAPSALVAQHHQAMLAALKVQDAEGAAVATSQGSLELAIETVNVTLDGAGDSQLAALTVSVLAGVEMCITTDGLLTPSIPVLTITVPGEPVFSQVIEKVLVPELITALTGSFLRPIQIKPLDPEHVMLSPPAVITGEGRLLATVAQSPALPDLASLDAGWPQHVAFAAVDSALLDVLLDGMAGQPVTGSWHKTYGVSGLSLTVNATYSVSASKFDLSFVHGHDGQLTGTANVLGSAHIWCALGSMTAKVSATPDVEATALITGSELQLKLDVLKGFKIALDIENVPHGIDVIISDVLDALSAEISAALTLFFSTLPPLSVHKIPSFTITVNQQSAHFTLQGLAITTITAPDGRNLLALTGNASVAALPPAAVTP